MADAGTQIHWSLEATAKTLSTLARWLARSDTTGDLKRTSQIGFLSLKRKPLLRGPRANQQNLQVQHVVSARTSSRLAREMAVRPFPGTSFVRWLLCHNGSRRAWQARGDYLV